MKTMKKRNIIALLLAFALVLTAFAACVNKDDDSAKATETIKIKVGASPTPHAEILAQVVDDLKAEGIDLEIVEFTDYVLPNTSLDAGDIQANYFQHQPYLDSFNKENGTDIVSIGAIHYEPFGIYPGKTAKLEDLKEGAKVAVPNDATNEARALLLLETAGLIKLKDGAGIEATKNDIIDNPKNLEVVEIAAEQLPRTIQDVDISAINGNYALEAGLNAGTDALFVEPADSLAATTYANIIAVNASDKDKPELVALVNALKSDKVKKFIEDTYQGAVVAVF
jgi:D-methionine transport system substrate-binding protein